MRTGRCKGCGIVVRWVTSSSTDLAYVFANHASLDTTRRYPGHTLATAPAHTAHHFTCTARGGPGAAPPPPPRRVGEGEQGTLF